MTEIDNKDIKALAEKIAREAWIADPHKKMDSDNAISLEEAVKLAELALAEGMKIGKTECEKAHPEAFCSACKKEGVEEGRRQLADELERETEGKKG